MVSAGLIGLETAGGMVGRASRGLILRMAYTSKTASREFRTGTGMAGESTDVSSREVLDGFGKSETDGMVVLQGQGYFWDENGTGRDVSI